MSVVSFLLSFLPLAGLASLWAAVHYARKVERLRQQVEAQQVEVRALRIQLAASTNDLADCRQALVTAGQVAAILNGRLDTAQARAAQLQADAAALALQVAQNPDAEAAARLAAEKLMEAIHA